MQAFGLNIFLNVVAIIALIFTGQIHRPGAHVLLALATAAGAVMNTWLLYRGLRKQNVYQPLDGWRALLLRIVFASFVMAVALHFFAGDTSTWVELNSFTRILWLSGLIAGGVTIYFASLWLFGLRPAHLKH
jgi:putative peptidoglycan lipid II flippase